VAKVGRVSYQLNLPKESLIHNVFHVSQLKKKVGPTSTVLLKLPLTGPDGRLQFWPVAILKRRIFKRNNQVEVEVLIQWANLPAEESTCENYQELKNQFPNVSLEDKTVLEGEVLSAQLIINCVETELVAVAKEFDLVKTGIEGIDGPPEEELGLGREIGNKAQHVTVLDSNGEEAQGENGEEE
jgi:hypothetical protein